MKSDLNQLCIVYKDLNYAPILLAGWSCDNVSRDVITTQDYVIQ